MKPSPVTFSVLNPGVTRVDAIKAGTLQADTNASAATGSASTAKGAGAPGCRHGIARRRRSRVGIARTTAWLSALLMAGGLAVAGPVLAATASPSGSSASGSGGTNSSRGGGADGSGTANAAAGGPEKILQVAMPPCSTCHQVKPGINQPGPSLAGVATRASQRIKAKDYKGKARDAKAYLRESIMDPNAYIVPGPSYAASGKSLMPATYAQTLKPEQVDQIVNYLMTLK